MRCPADRAAYTQVKDQRTSELAPSVKLSAPRQRGPSRWVGHVTGCARERMDSIEKSHARMRIG